MSGWRGAAGGLVGAVRALLRPQGRRLVASPDDAGPRADAAMAARDWAEAARLYALALERAPGRAALRVQMAHALKEQGLLDAAEAAYRRAAADAPDDPDPALHLGHMLLGRGATLAGIAALRRAEALGDAAAGEAARDAAAGLDADDMASWPGLAAVAPGAGAMRMAGRVAGPVGAAVRGWAADAADPLRPVTAVLRGPDGAVLAEVATAPTPQTPPAEACAFVLPIPPALLDGAERALTVEIDGAVPPGGRLTFRLLTGGACFVDAARGEIRGWTESGLGVTVAFDGGAPVAVEAEAPVANIATPSARGFATPIPPALLDGAAHEAAVALDPAGGTLAGAPLRFALTPPRPQVALHAVVGRRIAGALVDADGAPVALRLAAAFDDGPAAPIASCAPRVDGAAPRARADFALTAPPGARRLRLDALDGPAPGPLAAFDLADPAPPAAEADAVVPGAVEDVGEAQAPAVFDLLRGRLEGRAKDLAALAADDAAAAEAARAAPLGGDAPLVSIVMPTFNRAHTLAEAVQSVIEQRYRRWELLIADDASTDRTAQVAQGFRDPRVRYFAFEKSNGAGARNKALRFARGEVIAYLDSDNVWSPWFLSTMVRRLGRGAMAVCGGYADTTLDGARARLEAVRRPAFHPISMHQRNVVDLNAYVHHRALYDWLGGFDPALPRLQDWDMILRHSAILPPVESPLALTFYRRNAAWGQVTQLFMGAGVRGTVLEKSERRVATGQPRLALRMARPADVGIVAADRPGALAMAQGLARLAGPTADVSIHRVGGDGAVPARLARDPVALGRALAAGAGHDALIAIGLPPGAAEALADGSGGPVLALDHGRVGLALRRIGEGLDPWPLGAPPLDPAPAMDAEEPVAGAAGDPVAHTAGEGAETPPTLLLLAAADDPAPEAAAALLAALSARWTVFAAPADPLGEGWFRAGPAAEAASDNTTAEAASESIAAEAATDQIPAPVPLSAAQALAEVRARATIVVAPAGLRALDPAAFALAAELMGRGAGALTPFLDDWRPFFEMGAVHRLRGVSPEEVVERVAALASLGGARARRRATQAWRIALHPEVAQERMRALACLLAHGGLR